MLLDPVLADNVSDEGRETLESWQVDGLDPLWPLGLQIEGWTSYEPEQAIDCAGMARVDFFVEDCVGPGE